MRKSKQRMKYFLVCRLLPLLPLLALSALGEKVTQCELPAVIAPYLMNPVADGITVCVLARQAEKVRVRYASDEAVQLTDVDGTGKLIPGTPWTIWKIKLSPLHAGGYYKYQVHYRLEGKDEASALYHFTLPDPGAKSFRVACFNDIHNNSATLEALMRKVKSTDYEAVFLLGDMWNDPSGEGQAEKVFLTMNSYVQLLNASEKPLFFVRGNHEVRGSFADRMASLFDLPLLDATSKFATQNWMYTFAAGPVWFAAMDTGDDFTKRFELFQPYRERQADWLKGVLARGEQRTVPWRILLTHMPLYNETIWNSEPSRLLWEPVLAGATIDLALAGHDHKYKLLPTGKTYTVKGTQEPDKQDPLKRAAWSFTTPYPVMIGGGPGMGEGTVMLICAEPNSLRVRLLGTKTDEMLCELTLRK